MYSSSSPASSASSALSSPPASPLPPTPGRGSPFDARDDDAMETESLNTSSAHTEGGTTAAGRRPRATYRAGNSKANTEAAEADAQRGQGDEASNTPQPPKSNLKRIRVKSVKALSTDDSASHAANAEGGASAEDGKEASAPAPRRSLKVKLSRRPAPAATSSPTKSSSPSTAATGPPPVRSPKDFADELRALASDDSDQEDAAPSAPAKPFVRGQTNDQDEEALPAKRARKRSWRAAEAGAIFDSDEEGQGGANASTSSKRKRPATAASRSKSGNGGAKKGKGKGRSTSPLIEDDADDDSDVIMSDVVSESDVEPAGGQKAQKPKKATPTASKRAQGSSSATNGKAQASAGEKKTTAGKINRKPTQAELTKMMASRGIRPSAAATVPASPKPGDASTPKRPLGALGAANRGGMPAQAGVRKPMPVKPRGSDMWDSLVGGSSKPTPAATPAKPTPAPTPSASDRDKLRVKPDSETGGEREAGEVAEQSQQGNRLAPAINLPRPLGIAREGAGGAATASPASASREHGHGHGHHHGGHGHRHELFREQSSIVVHNTPGLNGQHWDKEAYRQQRLREKAANRAPEPETLIDLLADAEVIQAFDSEWRAMRYSNQGRGGGQTQVPVYPPLRASGYGAGLSFAKTLREARQRREETERNPATARA